LGIRKYEERAVKMLTEMSGSIDFAPGFSNWLLAILEWQTERVEVVFTGPDATSNSARFQEKLKPFVLVAASTVESELPLFQGRVGEHSAIYVCRNRSCDLPIYRVEDIQL
jgi:uncharacterized protein YyaL (SSP411 family)